MKKSKMNLVIENSASRQIGKEFKKRKLSTKREQTGKCEYIFKRFLKKVGGLYKCDFCKKPFKEDDYLKQLEVHLKNFHNVPEKEFNQLFKPLFVVSGKNNFHVQHTKMKKDDVSNSKVESSCIKTSKIKLHEKNGQSKNDEVNKELKKVMKSKLKKESKKNIQTTTVNQKSKKDDDGVLILKEKMKALNNKEVLNIPEICFEIWKKAKNDSRIKNISKNPNILSTFSKSEKSEK